MKPTPVLLLLLSALAASGSSHGALPLILGVTGGTADPALKQQFLKLAAAKDADGLGKLAKSRPDDTVAWIVATCEELINRPNSDAESFATTLREAWKAGIGSGFADREYEAFKNMGSNRRDRNDLKGRFDLSQQELEKNVEHKDSLSFQNVVDEMEIVAPGLEQVGDWYSASEAWILQGRAYDEPMRGESADLHKACVAYIHAIEAREKVDLKDSTYEEILKRKTALVGKGYDKKKEAPPVPSEPPKPGEAGVPPPGPDAAATSSAGAPFTAAASFEPIAAIDTYLRPNFADDEVNMLWGGLPIKGKGTSATFTRMEAAPAVVRAGPSDIRVDTNGDGQGDEKLTLAGNPVLVKVTIGKGPKARPWAFMAQVGNEKDQYQKVQVNNQPNDQNYTIYTLSAASIVANVAGVPVRVIDEDMDGVYGNRPQIWGEIGLTKEVFQPEMDSILIGPSKRARPWSEVQEIGGKWYKLEPDPVGKEIKATPMTVETGILKLDFKGPAPTWVVVQAQGEQVKGCFFDLVEGGAKGVSVPVGKYRLFYGEMRKGKKNLVEKTLILPGKSTPPVEVVKGQAATLSLGAPFGFDFHVTTTGDKAKVEGGTVVVVGSQGERYERPWNCVSRPEVYWRKKGTKTTNSAGKMSPFQDPNGFSKGYDIAWFPLDMEVALKNEKGPVEFQLVEKKHDLFGRIESDWKE